MSIPDYSSRAQDSQYESDRFGARSGIPSTGPAGSQGAVLASSHELQVGLASDPGRVRDHNEDASLALQFMWAQQGQPPLPVGLFILADGMGGHAQGERASALVVRLAARHIIDQHILTSC